MSTTSSSTYGFSRTLDEEFAFENLVFKS